MNSEIKVIETRYKGYRFRSRLEARWAVFFDAMDIDWEYESEGYELKDAPYFTGQCIPGFWLPASWLCSADGLPAGAGYFVEVEQSPAVRKENDNPVVSMALALATASKHTVKILVGSPGKHCEFIAHGSGHRGWVDEVLLRREGNIGPGFRKYYIRAVAFTLTHPAKYPDIRAVFRDDLFPLASLVHQLAGFCHEEQLLEAVTESRSARFE